MEMGGNPYDAIETDAVFLLASLEKDMEVSGPSEGTSDRARASDRVPIDTIIIFEGKELSPLPEREGNSA